MIEIVRLLTTKARSFGASGDVHELNAARECLQNTLHVLERTLQFMECDPAEPLSTTTSARK